MRSSAMAHHGPCQNETDQAAKTHDVGRKFVWKPITVSLGGALSDFVAANVGPDGSYENVSEYVRDLIRRDKERAENEVFERLKAELSHAFAAPETSYKPLTAAEVIARHRT